MSFHVQQANSADMYQIRQIINSVWPESPTPVSQMVALAGREGHSLLVAKQGNEVFGFVSGFITHSFDRVRRWELDLLAVSPHHQSMRVGTSLIRACDTVAGQQNAMIIRTVVRTDNKSMQTACLRCGYEKDPVSRSLLIHQPADARRIRDTSCGGADAYVVEVHTLTYSGLWIEGSISKHSLENSIICRDELKLDTVGALVDVSEAEVIQTARNMGYVAVGDYNYWYKPID